MGARVKDAMLRSKHWLAAAATCTWVVALVALLLYSPNRWYWD
jgi:hypothetical protein